MSYTDEDAKLITSYGWQPAYPNADPDEHEWETISATLYQPNDPVVLKHTLDHPRDKWNVCCPDRNIDAYFDTAAQACAWAALQGITP